METVLNLLNEIQAERSKFNRPMAPPATVEELQHLREEAQQKLRYTLPQAYLDVLAKSNGVDLNGIQLYASEAQTRMLETGRTKYIFRGLVEANMQWRGYEPNKEHVYFAESGGELYCHNLSSEKFEIVDRITNEVIYAPSLFDTCEELLEMLFNHMLDRYGMENVEEDEAAE